MLSVEVLPAIYGRMVQLEAGQMLRHLHRPYRLRCPISVTSYNPPQSSRPTKRS